MKGKLSSIGWLMAGTALALAMPASAQDAPQQPLDDAAEGEIVVTGIRGSIAEALETKREAANILDSISAQDIGKLPDQNVVDTLSRIPGVQITRSRGEGANFTIRGISLNNTLINGRTFVGATSDSSARLDVLSSDIVASIDVIKSPSADMIEGALGGTVDLKTKRPLDLPPMTVALRAQGQYGDNIRKVGFRGSALFSTKLLDDRLGILANLAYQYLQVEQQLFDASNFTRVNDIDGNGDGVNDPNLIRPARLQVNALPRPVERVTFNSALQFKATDTLQLMVEGTYNFFNATGTPQRFQVLVNSNDVGAIANANGTVLAATLNGVTPRPLVYQEDDRSTVYALGGRAEWKHDGWEAVLDASYGRGKAPFDLGTFTAVVVPRAGRVTNVAYDLRGNNDLPSFSLTSNFDLMDPNQYQVQSISDNSNTNDNESLALRLDLGRELNLGFLSKISAGYRYEDRSFYTARRVLSRTLASLVAVADSNGDGILTPNEIPGIHYGPLRNPVLQGLSGNLPREWLAGTVDAAAVRKQFGYDLPPIAPTTVSDVNVRGHAFYAKLDLQGDIAGMSFRGNVGARYIKTDRVSSGNIEVLNVGIRPVSYDKSYSDFLPSATLILDLTDKLVLRAAAAKVVATPPLSDLAAGFTYSIVSNTGSGGNPLLNPYKADQADISLEWYFGRANLLSASLFTKKVRSFTRLIVTEETLTGFVNPNGTGNVFRITRPENGSDGPVKGFEVNYQHALTFLPVPFDGLGVQANYTYADSKTPIVDELSGRTVPLPNLSKQSYSLIAYYEKHGLSGRVAYTWRDDYLFTVQGAALGGSRYVAASNQLDASISYSVTPSFKLTFDAQNLLKRPETMYDGAPERVVLARIDDRRFFFGGSITF